MSFLHRPLNLYKIQPGFNMKFADSKDYTHSLFTLPALGYFHCPGHSIELENALKGREYHRVS